MSEAGATARAEVQAKQLAQRQALSGDPHRPRYHFLPPANWLNDPNGLLWWRGRYHLFYQHNPAAPVWGQIHWGHAVSDDLVHWTDLPIALAPTPGGADADGCFSGCAVVHDGRPTLVYTGVRGEAQRPCLAFAADPADPDLVAWRKYPGNPVIPAPPPGLDLVGFRDHSVWREGDGWRMVIGAGIRDVGGAALLFASPDLIDWTYRGPLLTGDLHRDEPFYTGRMWECPDFFPLGDKHVLIYSAWDDVHPPRHRYAAYVTGAYADERLHPETEGILDHGGHFYAPQTMRDARGRRLIWGWLDEGRDRQTWLTGGWAGVLSLPRVLTLLPDGHVGAAPVPELTALRGQGRRLTDATIPAGEAIAPAGAAGDCLELAAELVAAPGTVAGLEIRRSPDGAEATAIAYDWARGELTIDAGRASLAVPPDRPAVAPLVLPAGEPLRLRVFVDRSVIEVFANDRVCLAERVYPTRPDAVGVRAFARGGPARLTAFAWWSMAAIWP